VKQRPTADSLWRIELARELIPLYVPHEGIVAAILSGSPPKGLSDEYSDLDVIVFWSEIDAEWLEANPLRDIECERKYFRKMGEQDVYLESHYFGALKFDVGHSKLSSWEEEIDDVVVRHDADPSKLGAMAGFLTAVPLHGEDVVERLKERAARYPDELADKVIRMHRRFFVPGYLMNQAYGRGDRLAYCDGLCLMLKNLLNILAGLNHVYLSTEEPRWLGYYLSRMPIKPERVAERIEVVLGFTGEDSVGALEDLTVDVLALIAEHKPDMDDGYEERWRGMAVSGCAEKPEVRRRR
jgi:hypothetical protein